MISMQIIGRLGKNAEVKQVSGRQVINFSVAHSFKKTDGTDVTVWVDAAYWRDASQSVTIAQYLTKGTQVYLQGEPTARAYVSNTGDAAAVLGINVQRIELLGSKQDSQATAPAQPVNNATGNAPAGFDGPADDDDLPF